MNQPPAKRTRVVFIRHDWSDNLGVLWMSAVLRRAGFDTRVYVDEKTAFPEIARFKPDILGLSCLTGEQQWVTDVSARVRATGANPLVLVGGPHPTFFPEMIDTEGVDAICRGEGEETILELAETLEAGQDPTAIRNLTFKRNGGIIENPLRPLIKNLDSLPLPDRSYYRRYRFLAENPFKIFITGRGCPFQCTFCFNHVLLKLYGNSAGYVRRRSPEQVMEEVLQVDREWGIGHLRFSDDHFVIQKDWLRTFCDMYKRELRKPYTINARADIMDEERVSLLAESGCRLVCLGLETGNENLRNQVLKKKVTDEQIIRAASLIKKHGMRIFTSSIIGLPNETAEDAWKTIEMNQRIGTDLPWYSMMQYYPGTEVHRQAQELGLLPDDSIFDHMGSYFDNKYLKQDNLGTLTNIHRFSILTSKLPILTRPARWLAAHTSPNPMYKVLFKATYALLTFRRAGWGIGRLAREITHNLGRV